MVLFRHIVAFILAQLAIAAPAEHVTRKAGRCETFTLYCGHTLKGLGWGTSQIQDKVEVDKWNDGQVPTREEVDESLFKCAGQGESLVWLNGRKPCGGCVNAGPGHSDYCG